MVPRLPVLPTFDEFLSAARHQGCTEKLIRGRLVLENPELRLPVVLKEMQGNERLTQFYAEYLCRMLGVVGFSAHEVETFPDQKPSEGEQT